MARPKKQNAEYFSHDCDMRNDLKIKALRRKYGHEGYSFWNMMLEFLGDCDYFEYEWTPLNIELLSPDFDIDADRIEEIVQYCIKLELLQIMHGYLTCHKFTQRLMDTLSTKRTDFSIVNSNRMKIEESLRRENSINFTENPQSKVKESIEEKSIEEYRTLHESVVEYSIEKESKFKQTFEDDDILFLNQEKMLMEASLWDASQPNPNNSDDLKNLIQNKFSS